MNNTIQAKTLADGFQPKVPLWPDKNIIKLPTVQPISLINTDSSWFKRVWTFLTKRPKFIVKEDYFIWIDYLDAWCWVPENFVYDFASIPKFIPVINPTGVFAYPALPHDFIYRFGCLLISKNINDPFKPIHVNRKIGDEIFNDLAKKSNNLGLIDSISTGMLRLLGGSNYKPRNIMTVDWSKLVK